METRGDARASDDAAPCTLPIGAALAALTADARETWTTERAARECARALREHAGSLQMEFVARAIATADKTSAIVEAWLDDRSDAVGAVGVDAGEVSARVRGAATAARAGARRGAVGEAKRRGGRERGGVAMRQGDAKRCEWGC